MAVPDVDMCSQCGVAQARNGNTVGLSLSDETVQNAKRSARQLIGSNFSGKVQTILNSFLKLLRNSLEAVLRNIMVPTVPGNLLGPFLRKVGTVLNYILRHGTPLG